MHKNKLILITSFGLLLMFAFAFNSRATAQSVANSPAVIDQLIIQYQPRSGIQLKVTSEFESQMQNLSAEAGIMLEYARPMSGDAHVLRLPTKITVEEAEKIADKLSALPEIAYAEPDYIMLPITDFSAPLMLVEPNDTYYADQWHYFTPVAGSYGVNAPEAWDFTTGSSSIYVAVLDTGILNHEDLVGRWQGGYDMISTSAMGNDGDGRDANPLDPGDWVTANECYAGSLARDSSWHGTHVAGTIGAASNNGMGVAGLNWVSKIIPVRVLGKCGGYTSDIADGIRWAAGLSVTGVPNNPYPVQVINMSLGGGGSCDATSQNAINDAVAAGTTVVVAAGNNNANASNYSPASCNNVITVAATNRDGSRAYYSNYGSVVEISAPGGAQSYANDPNGVLSTLNTGTQGPVADSYEYYQGTSMAAPHVAGVASLVLSMDPSLTPAEILTILQNTVTPFPGGSTCNTSICGSGIVNAGLAVQSANPPIIEVDPASLEVGLTPESQLTQTLTISNSGGDDLTWAITESVTIASLPADPLIAAEAAVTRGGDLNFALDTAEPAAEDAQVAPRPDVSPTFVTPNAVLLDTVQLVNSPGTGAGGADESMVQNSSLGMTSLGFGHQVANGNRVADDFTIADPGGWQIDTITFFAYQTGSPTASTITAVNLRIWDGPPNDPASTVVFGDTTTNRLSSSAWSGIYRVSETSSGGTTRPIMANVVTVNIQLPPGTYWLDWQAGGTLTSGPWAPPITINGQTTTGNALQYTGSWAAALDGGTLTPQGLPFIIDGNAIAAATCSPTSDLSWVSVAPLSGTLTPGANESLDVIFDSTGLTTGEYTGTLCLDSNDPVTPQVQVPLTMTVCTQPAAVTDVSISRGGSDINLSWSTVSGATSYRIYRAANSPYFSSGPLFIYDLALSNSYTDASVTGDPANNYYYIVQSVSACGAGAVESGHSNRTAKFEYPLQPGTP